MSHIYRNNIYSFDVAITPEQLQYVSAGQLDDANVLHLNAGDYGEYVQIFDRATERLNSISPDDIPPLANGNGILNRIKRVFINCYRQLKRSWHRREIAALEARRQFISQVLSPSAAYTAMRIQSQGPGLPANTTERTLVPFPQAQRTFTTVPHLASATERSLVLSHQAQRSITIVPHFEGDTKSALIPSHQAQRTFTTVPHLASATECSLVPSHQAQRSIIINHLARRAMMSTLYSHQIFSTQTCGLLREQGFDLFPPTKAMWEIFRKFNNGHPYAMAEYLAHKIPYVPPQDMQIGRIIPYRQPDGSVIDLIINDFINAEGLVCYLLTPQVYRENEPFEVKILFRGTKDKPSIGRDIEPYSPGHMTFQQYESELLLKLQTLTQDKEEVSISIYGHSLGGSDAQRAHACIIEARRTNHAFQNIISIETSTFNSPGIASATNAVFLRAILACNYSVHTRDPLGDEWISIEPSATPLTSRITHFKVGGDMVQRFGEEFLGSPANAPHNTTQIVKINQGFEGWLGMLRSRGIKAHTCTNFHTDSEAPVEVLETPEQLQHHLSRVFLYGRQIPGYMALKLLTLRAWQRLT